MRKQFRTMIIVTCLVLLILPMWGHSEVKASETYIVDNFKLNLVRTALIDGYMDYESKEHPYLWFGTEDTVKVTMMVNIHDCEGLFLEESGHQLSLESDNYGYLFNVLDFQVDETILDYIDNDNLEEPVSYCYIFAEFSLSLQDIFDYFEPGEYRLSIHSLATGDVIMIDHGIYIYSGQTGTNSISLDPDDQLAPAVETPLFNLDATLWAGDSVDPSNNFTSHQKFKVSEQLNLQIANGKPPLFSMIYDHETYEFLYEQDGPAEISLVPGDVYPYGLGSDEGAVWFEEEIAFDRQSSQLSKELGSGYIIDLQIAKRMYEHLMPSGSYRLLIIGSTMREAEGYGAGPTYLLTKPFYLKRLESFNFPSTNYITGENIDLGNAAVILNYGNEEYEGVLTEEFNITQVIGPYGDVSLDYTNQFHSLAPGHYTVYIECLNSYTQLYMEDKNAPMYFDMIVDDNVVNMEDSFPDPQLRLAVYNSLGMNMGAEVKTSDLAHLEVLSAANPNPDNLGIVDIMGLELLRNIREIDLSGNKVAGGILNLPPNTYSITKLNVSNMGLISLNFWFCGFLTELDCSNNMLTNLYFSYKDFLTTVDCSHNNLEELNVSDCSVLETLDCSYNDLISVNDISGYRGFLPANLTFSPQHPIIPSDPGNPNINKRGTNSLTINWTASTSRDGIAGYEVYRNNVLLDTISGLSFTDTNLMMNTSYEYAIRAVANLGGTSSLSRATLSTANLFFEKVVDFKDEYLLNVEYINNLMIQGVSQTGYDMSEVTVTMYYNGLSKGRYGNINIPNVRLGNSMNGYLFTGTWYVDALPADTYEVYFEMTNIEGETVSSPTQTVVLSIDGSSPIITLNQPSAGALIGGSNNIKISGVITDNIDIASAAIEYKNGSGEFILLTTLQPGLLSLPFNVDIPTSAILQGSVYELTIQITASDSMGNTNALLRKINIDAYPPAPVANFIVTSTTEFIEIMWNYEVVDSDFHHFNVYREDSQGNLSQFNNGKVLGRYEDITAGILDGESYTYYVTAVDALGNESPASERKTGMITKDLTSPIIGSFTPYNNADLCRSVDIAVASIDNYQLARLVLEYSQGTDGVWQYLDTIAAKANSNNEIFRYSWDISGLVGTYQLKMSVYDEASNAPAIEIATYNISAYTPPLSPILEAISGQHKMITLDWEYKGDLDALYCFRIYRDGHLINTVAKSTFTFGDVVSNDIAYDYTVVAVDRFNQIASSNNATATALSSDIINPIPIIAPDELLTAIGSTFTFSAALSTDNDAIASYHWDFGDAQTGSGRMIKHSYALAGFYTVRLTVTDDSGNSAFIEAEMEVLDVTTGETGYTLVEYIVVDAAHANTPVIEGVTLVFQSESAPDLTAVSDVNGIVHILLPNGQYTVSTLKDGYLTRTFTLVADVAEGFFSATIGLSKVSLVTGDLIVKEMTYEEIVEAGIDLSNPNNQHVSKVEVVFEFEVGASKYELPVAYYRNEVGQLVDTKYNSGYQYDFVANGVLTTGEGAHGVSVNVGVYPISEKFFLVVYGEAHWLKEMYNVELLVINNSNTDSIENCLATLDLPVGLSLAAMIDRVQTNSIDLGTIEKAGGQNQAVANWYVSGDVEGEYFLSASVEGTNMPLGDHFHQEFTTTSSLKVYAGSALHLNITAQPYAYRGGTYHVNFTLTNTSPKTLYNLSFAITGANQYQVQTVEGFTNAIIWNQSDFQNNASVGVGALAPGQSVSINFSTPVWFSSVLEPRYNVTYLLRNVFVTTLEGSTTEIPYTVTFGLLDRQLVTPKVAASEDIYILEEQVDENLSLNEGESQVYDLVAVAGGTFEISLQNAQLITSGQNPTSSLGVIIEGDYVIQNDKIIVTDTATLTLLAAKKGDAQVSISYNDNESYEILASIKGENDVNVDPDWDALQSLLTGYIYGETLAKIALPTDINGIYSYEDGSVIYPAGAGSVMVLFEVTADVDNKGNIYKKTFEINVEPAVYTFEIESEKIITKGSGLSALGIVASAKGVNGEVVKGDLRWFSDAERQKSVEDVDLANLDWDSEITIYYVFTPLNEPNYVTASQSGSLLIKIPKASDEAKSLTFSVTTVSKTIGDAKFTYTATSVGLVGEISYYSSNEEVAIVNKQSGEVTLVGVGTTDISAMSNIAPNLDASYTLYVANKGGAVLPPNDGGSSSGTTPPNNNTSQSSGSSGSGSGSGSVAGGSSGQAVDNTSPTEPTTSNTTETTPGSTAGTQGGSTVDGTGNQTTPNNTNVTNGNTDKTGNVVVIDLTPEQIAGIIAEGVQTGSVQFNLSELNDASAASLATEIVQGITEAGAGLAIGLTHGQLDFDAIATKALIDQAEGESLEFSIIPIDHQDLILEQRSALKLSDIVLDINVSAAGKVISSFDGILKVNISYVGALPVSVWYLADDGSLEEVASSYDEGVLTFELYHLSLYIIRSDAPETRVNPFLDVNEEDWFYADILFAYQRSLLVGVNSDHFDPEGIMNRGMIVTVLGRLADVDMTAYNGASFNDVDLDEWYAPYVKWAADMGIIHGIGENNFAPQLAVTRQDLAVILHNYALVMGLDLPLKEEEVIFGDHDLISDYARDSVKAMQMAGIIGGKPGLLIDAGGGATRAQVAAILHRYLEVLELN